MTAINVQLENGYTRIANEILENLVKADLNGTQLKIVLIVFRYTYGFQRKEHPMSLKFISEATGIHKMQIQREITDLIDRKFLIVSKEADFNNPRTISFNKKYSKWLRRNSKQLASKLTVSENDNETVSELVNSTVSLLANQERKYKDNNKDIQINDFFDRIWKLLPRKRGKAKVTKKQKKLLFNEVGEDALVEAIKLFNKEMKEKEEKHIPYGSTFLNSGYVDYLELVQDKKKNEVIPTGKIKYITDEDIQNDIDEKHKEKIRKAEEVKKNLTYYDG